MEIYGGVVVWVTAPNQRLIAALAVGTAVLCVYSQKATQ